MSGHAVQLSEHGHAPYLRGDLPVVHGFSTRQGGVSAGPYASLNLGLSSGDEAAAVESNRDRLLTGLGFQREQVCALHQVHGRRVLDGSPTWFGEQADAAVTDDPTTLLVISVADCLPLLFHDPATGAVGAAHCGWRGTVAGLAGRVVKAMTERFGTDPRELRVLMGPGVAGECYQVGAEVVTQFSAAGFPDSVAWPDAEQEAQSDVQPDAQPAARPGKYRLDLKAANRWQLQQAGVAPGSIMDLGLCTHCQPERFFSYRRDAGTTGRHWAFVSPKRA